MDELRVCAGNVCRRSGVETIMIKNGLYSLHAKSRDGAADDVGGVLILRDGELHGGDAYVFLHRQL